MTLILKAIPATLKDAVDLLEFELTDWERNHVLAMPRPQSCDGLGLLSRPEWCLWDRRSPLVEHFVEEYALAHTQDISCVLMEALWSRVHGAVPITRTLAAALRTRWRSRGVDPVTLLPIPSSGGGQPPVILHSPAKG